MAAEIVALLVKYAVPILVTTIATLVSRIVGHLAGAAADDANRKHSNAEATLAKTLHIIETVVLDIEQTLRPTISEVSADGHLTKEGAEKIRLAALTKIKSYLGEEGLKKITTELGIPDGILTDYLLSLLEAQIQKINWLPKSPASIGLGS